MRLTLRTMLCYLDDVLEPADAKELGAKIEESEYATNVVHRVRTSMRRLRLGAPAVSGEGMGFDPNTVADYLDNTLAPEQVADFERVCLDVESESQLAEVAACHQVLTLVLGEPAEVSPAMRHRVYRLGQLDEQQLANTALAAEDESDAPVMATTASTDASPASTTQQRIDDAPSNGKETQPEPARKDRQKPEIPDYLRQNNNQRIWPLALAALLLVIVLGGIALTVWPPGGPRPNNDVALNDPQDDDQNNNVPNGDQPDPLFQIDDQTPPPTGTPRTPADATNGRAAVGNANNGNAASNPAADGGAPDASSGGTPPAGVEDGPPRVKTPLDDDATDPPVAAEPPKGGGETPFIDGGPLARINPATTPPAGGGAGEPILPPVDKVAAHYTSTSQVMIGWDNEAAGWKRLPPRAPLKPGAQIRSLPTYRPQILLTNDIQITFADEASASIGNPVDDLPSIELTDGKAVIATMSKAGNGVALTAGGRNVRLGMVDEDAAVAVMVSRFHLPGDNPETDLAHVEVVGLVTSGQIQWQQAGTEPVTLDAGQAISMIDDSLPRVQTFETAPKWVKTNDISDIDRLASATLEPLLDEDRPMEIALAERAEHPRVEVRSLAARCLASIDKFDALIDTFNDESLKSYWSEHYDRAQGAAARGPATAVQLREAVERRKGADAERVYRLLQGYSPEQLKMGGDKTLVDYLKHESLDVRVLAINNLRRITGRTFGYHPHLPEVRRRTAEREWEQAAASNSIVYASPPPELPKREPALP